MSLEDYLNCRKNCVHRTLIDLKNMSRLEKPRNIAQKRCYREHEFGGFTAVRRANRDRSTRTDLQQCQSPFLVGVNCLSKQRAQKGHRRLPASSSNRIAFALIITINISCTGSRRQKARVFAMSLPRIGVVELTNAPYTKHVPFAGTSCTRTNIAVTPAAQPAI